MKDYVMKCKRCGDSITVYVVGERYCIPCKRDVRTREEADARRMTARARFGTVKDTTDWSPSAA